MQKGQCKDELFPWRSAQVCLCLVKKQGSDEDHMDRLLRVSEGRSKNKKQARVSFDPQSLHNTRTASQSHITNNRQDQLSFCFQCACEMNTTQPPTTSQQRGEKQRKSLVYSIPSSKLVIASELNRFPQLLLS